MYNYTFQMWSIESTLIYSKQYSDILQHASKCTIYLTPGNIFLAEDEAIFLFVKGCQQKTAQTAGATPAQRHVHVEAYSDLRNKKSFLVRE